MIDPSHRWNISAKPLIWGFVLSILITLLAYYIAAENVYAGWALIVSVMVLAVIQGLLQLLLFLHIGIESKPRLNLMIFLFMVFVIFIIVGGSMWIMRNLDYNLMPTTGMNY